jgi:hypothetical protein
MGSIFWYDAQLHISIMLCEERLSASIDCMRGLVSRVINPVGDGISGDAGRIIALVAQRAAHRTDPMGLDNHCAIVLFRDREQAMADSKARWAATSN